MPLRQWICEKCGEQFKTKLAAPTHCGDVLAAPMITPPATAFKEKTSEEHGKSRLVGQETMLRERARSHSSNHEITDLIENNERDLAYQNGWLKTDGTVRRAIDDK